MLLVRLGAVLNVRLSAAVPSEVPEGAVKLTVAPAARLRGRAARFRLPPLALLRFTVELPLCTERVPSCSLVLLADEVPVRVNVPPAGVSVVLLPRRLLTLTPPLSMSSAAPVFTVMLFTLP